MKTQFILAATASLLLISANAASARTPVPSAPQAAQVEQASGVAASSAEFYCQGFRNYPQRQRCLQLHGLPVT